MGNKIVLLLFILLPSILGWLALNFTNDLQIFFVAVMGIGYALGFLLYTIFVEKFAYKMKLAKEFMGYKDRIFDGIKLGVIIGFAVALVGVLYSMFAPWGAEIMTMNLPEIEGGLNYAVYSTLGIFLLGFFLLSHLFFNFFCYDEWTEKSGLLGS